MGLRGLQMGLYGLKWAYMPTRPKMGLYGLQNGPIWPTNGPIWPRNGPIWPKMGLYGLQGLKWAYMA